MTSRRVLKAAEAIREVVSMAILAEIKDPRVQGVTVTHVEVAPDLRSAKVHVSVLGDETRARLSLAGLKSAAGFLQSRLAARIDTRYTPRLEFVLDLGVKRSIQIAEILSRVLPGAPPVPAPSPPATPAEPALPSNEPLTAPDQNPACPRAAHPDEAVRTEELPP